MENNIEQRIRYRAAEKRVKKLKGFYIHSIVFVFVNVLILVLKMTKLYPEENFWSWEYLKLPLFWGIGLAAHGVSVFFPTLILGKSWEEKKIRELMEKDK
ncbi:2TM domain-containing protein [Chryseobacterium chendengshani]|uniref:2TM domain-containing protein n=1 Tax=Chryseobacterium sp. LJ668 TaxID=2864040 RepID=UPI001C68F5F2|nr:2TM domain-containing protein [Chryseobacterium sp. LJ668]MBW8522082.1 2TM domain-containing protein [Chryseobacterium sp. LJ668]QYK17730.1 2TM domain-containing protein [Chryseobacterium sp. LJ668]